MKPTGDRKDWFTLEDYIESLLRDGKRSQHEDFQRLFKLYFTLFGEQGKQRVIDIAKRKLKEWEEKPDDDLRD